MWSLTVNLRLLKASVEFLWWRGVCPRWSAAVLMFSNPKMSEFHPMSAFFNSKMSELPTGGKGSGLIGNFSQIFAYIFLLMPPLKQLCRQITGWPCSAMFLPYFITRIYWSVLVGGETDLKQIYTPTTLLPIGTSVWRSSGRRSGIVVRAVDCWQ